MPTCDCCSTVREGGEGRAEMVVRVQAQDQSWVWLYMVLQLQPGEIPISSNNYIIRYLLTFFFLNKRKNITINNGGKREKTN